ncbi:MAG: rod shape-determining protein MreC [Nitrospiria bacterium]
MVHLIHLYKRLLVLFIAIVILVLLLSPMLQKKTAKWIGPPIVMTISYFQQSLDSLFEGVGQAWYGYLYLVDARKENKRLKQMISKLKGDNNRFIEETKLAKRLQVILDFKKRSRLDLITAEVIARNPAQWFDTIMINKGKRDGVQPDMGVLVPDGVIGKVVNIGPDYAQIQLISDRNSAIGAIVQETRDAGIAQGMNAGTLRLKYLQHDSKVETGDRVVTSGMEGSFPKGLYIGEVVEIKNDKSLKFLQVKISTTDLSRHEEVLVIRSIEDQF